MLRLSANTRYALYTMIELAKHEGQGMTPLKEVAEKHHLSEKCLGRLAISLRHAGLLFAERGAQGGYVLARPASEITAREIVQAADGPLSLVDCIGHPARCAFSPDCASRELWCRLTETIDAVLSSATLADLGAGSSSEPPACRTLDAPTTTPRLSCRPLGRAPPPRLSCQRRRGLNPLHI